MSRSDRPERSGRVRGDDGVSLAELLVVMAVSGVLLLALGAVFVGTARTTGDAQARNAATADTRLALDTIGRRLRVAVKPPGQPSVIASAGARSLSFYASVMPAGTTTVPLPTLVQYEVVGDCLRERRTAGSWLTTDPPVVQWTAAPVDTCLARGAVNADGAPLFEYLTSATSATPLPLSGGVLSTVAREQVLSVHVRLALSAPGGRAARTNQARTRVTLVNRLNETLTGGG